jgi:hypothetical protein
MVVTIGAMPDLDRPVEERAAEARAGASAVPAARLAA